MLADLFALGLGGSLLAGYGMAAGKHRSWIHIIGLVVTFVISAYVIRNWVKQADRDEDRCRGRGGGVSWRE